MKNPLANKQLIAFLRDDDGIGMVLKLLAIAAVSVLLFGLTKLALIGFFLGTTIWLLGRTVKLAVAGAEQARETRHYIVRLERRLRDLEYRVIQAQYEPARTETQECYEKAS